MEESKLYLIFEFLPMDLKKYMESLGDGKQLDSAMVKSLTYQVLPLVLLRMKFKNGFMWIFEFFVATSCRFILSSKKSFAQRFETSKFVDKSENRYFKSCRFWIGSCTWSSSENIYSWGKISFFFKILVQLF